ncbi:metal-dependent hydrolase [Candidatus Electronema sp. TJ]|uniref:metal-dependent hydrolase n=1 Tax=Candidatus Electronema sp. TJ TaxID=3401573 RepID=UPI003AA87F7F
MLLFLVQCRRKKINFIFRMSPVSHFLLSWLTANTVQLDRRERLLVTCGGIAPDMDGLGIIADFLTRNSSRPLQWWGEYHHLLGHNAAFGALLAAFTLLCAKQRRTAAALLSLTVFHLHLFCDLVGSRGPDGFQWPLPYLWPFSKAWQWTWDGQWALNAWPNLLVTAAALLAAFYLAWKTGRSPLEFVSLRADGQFAAALRARLGTPWKS